MMGWRLELVGKPPKQAILATMNSNSTNCWNEMSLKAFHNCLDSIESPESQFPSSLPVILCADQSSKAFSAGMDLKAAIREDTTEKAMALFGSFENAMHRWMAMRLRVDFSLPWLQIHVSVMRNPI